MNLARGWSGGEKRQMEIPGGCVHLRGGGPGTRRGLSRLWGWPVGAPTQTGGQAWQSPHWRVAWVCNCSGYLIKTRIMSGNPWYLQRVFLTTGFFKIIFVKERYYCHSEPAGAELSRYSSYTDENSYPLQYPCLENSMGRGVWQATVQRVAKGWAWLSTSTKELDMTEHKYLLFIHFQTKTDTPTCVTAAPINSAFSPWASGQTPGLGDPTSDTCQISGASEAPQHRKQVSFLRFGSVAPVPCGALHVDSPTWD